MLKPFIAIPASLYKKKNPSRDVNQSISIEHVALFALLTQKAFYDERMFRATQTVGGYNNDMILGVPFMAISFRLEHLLDFYIQGGLDVEWIVEHNIVIATIKAKKNPKDPDLISAGVKAGSIIAHGAMPLDRLAHLFATSLALLCSQYRNYTDDFKWLETYRMLLDDFESSFLLEAEDEQFESMQFMFNCIDKMECTGTDFFVSIKDWRYKLSSTYDESNKFTPTKPVDPTLN